MSNCPSKGHDEAENVSLARGARQGAYLSTPQELPELKARDGGVEALKSISKAKFDVKPTNNVGLPNCSEVGNQRRKKKRA